MLTSEDVQKIASDLNQTCRKVVAPYVMERASLNEKEFEAWARSFIEDTLVRTLERQANKLDAVDEAMFDGYWRAMWSEYRKLRAAGAAQAGRA